MHLKPIAFSLTAALVMAGLAGCNATQTSSRDSSQPNNEAPAANILDPLQTQADGILTQLSTQFAGTPLANFTTCLSPTVNQLLDGPDGLLTEVVGGLQSGLSNQDPSVLQPALTNGVTDLTTGLQTLTTNLPAALMALNGGSACPAYMPGDSTSAPAPGTPTLSPAQLQGVLTEITTQIDANCPAEAKAACDQLKTIVSQIGTTATSFDGAISSIQGGGDPVQILQGLAGTLTASAGGTGLPAPGALPLPTDLTMLPGGLTSAPSGSLLDTLATNDPTGQLSGALTQLTSALSPITSAVPANPLTSTLGL